MSSNSHTPAGSFFPTSNVMVHGGTFNQHNYNQIHPATRSGFDRLLDFVAPNALYDSGHVVDPPKCYPGTRVAIIQTIIDWIAESNDANRDKFFTWLAGAAGAGKSAIGRSVCERCKEDGTLLASFFFGSRDPTRNHSRLFAATIAYQLCFISQGLRTAVSRAIEYDPFVFSRSLQIQLKLLVMDPMLANYANEPDLAPCLIVVDGLDECQATASQRDILDALHSLAAPSAIRIRVLVCSRQESHIITMFSAKKMSGLLFKILLDNQYSSWKDIEFYFRKQFKRIRKTHIFKAKIPSSWPTKDQLNQLKEKSSGQFIYASTVIGYVDSSLHRPQQRLDAVLGLRPPFKDLPFSELDALYSHLLNGTDDPSIAADIMAYVALYDEMRLEDIDKLLSLESGETEVYLFRLAAIVQMEEDRSGYLRARLLHKSFGDFLFDSDRSKELSKSKMETKAHHALRMIEIFSENHESCRFPYSNDIMRKLPISLKLGAISYEDWSTSAQLAFHNAVKIFPMNSYCEEVFSHSGPVDCMEHIFLSKFFELLFDLGIVQKIPSLYQDHFRVFCDCVLSQLKSKYINDWEINIKFTNLYLARFTPLHLSDSYYLVPPVIWHLASMQDNRDITNTFRQLLNKPDEELIISKAAMYCLEHLCDLSSTREAAQRHLEVPKFDRNYRKTRPWQWHRRRSCRYLARNVIVQTQGAKYFFRYSLTTYARLFSKKHFQYALIYPLHLLPWIHWNFIHYDHPVEPFDQYHGFLEYLVIILPRAGRFLPLIHLCETKTFALMSMMFPDQSRKARRAIAAYLDRMEVAVVEEDNEMAIH